MSDIPVETNSVNSAESIKVREAAALIRHIQKLAPILDESRLIIQEVQDVVATYGTVTDADLTELGVTAATITNLANFLSAMTTFMDNSTQTRAAYRASINSVRRIAAQI
jgi:hypothetical protein